MCPQRPRTDDVAVEVSPRVEAYLSRLPDGPHSHAEQRVRAGVVKTLIGEDDVDALDSALPSEIGVKRLLARTDSEWIPEVHSTSILLAMRDRLYPDDESFLRSAATRHDALFQQPAYRVLARMISAERIARIGVRLFSAIHEGSYAHVARVPEGLRMSFHHAPHMLPSLIAAYRAEGLAAVLRAGSLRDAPLALIEETPSRVVFLVEL